MPGPSGESCEFVNNAINVTDIGEWRESNAVRVLVAVFLEEEGGYSAIVLSLPGACGCGDTEQEALASARESILLLVETYQDEGMEIPWQPPQRDELIPPRAAIKSLLFRCGEFKPLKPEGTNE